MALRTPVARSPKVPEIRKGDTVVVLAGRDAGKRGKVERVVRRQPAPRGRSIWTVSPFLIFIVGIYSKHLWS